MKKVLFLSRLFKPHIGGVETHVLRVTQELSAQDHEIVILTTQHDQNLKTYEKSDDYEIFRIPQNIFQSKMSLWHWIWQHRDLFKVVDIVHVHDVFWWLIPVLPFISSKFFITFHGWEGSFPPSKSAIFQRKIAASLAKGVIQVGEYINKWYGTSASYTTYGGVDLLPRQIGVAKISELYKQVKLQPQQIIKTKFKYTIIFVGRLSADNDLPIVIDFFIQYKKRFPDAKFAFVGDGEFAHECNEIGDVTGFVKDVSGYILHSQMVCSNSYLSILQAQAAGKLVFSFFSNQLKADYLNYYPQAPNMVIASNAQNCMEQYIVLLADRNKYLRSINMAAKWARTQTWTKLAIIYIKLWKK